MSYLLGIMAVVWDDMAEMVSGIDDRVFIILITLSLEAVIIMLTSWYILMRTRPLVSQGHTNLISVSVAITFIVAILSILYYPVGNGEFNGHMAFTGAIVILFTLGWSALTIIGLDRKLKEIDEMDS